MHTAIVELHIPMEAYHELEGRLNKLSQEEKTALDISPYHHTRVAQYIFDEYVMSRRNLAEDIVGTTNVEVTERGEIRVTE